MKRWLKTLMLAGVFAMLLCGSALASDAAKMGMYDLKIEPEFASNVAVEFQTKDHGEATPESVVLRKIETTESVSINAERVSLTVNNQTGSECLVFILKGNTAEAVLGAGGVPVPTQGNIAYIDQKTGAASVTFDLYPKGLDSGKTYTICMATTSEGIKKVGTFKYYSSYRLGDIDYDGVIKTIDATNTLKMSAKKKTPTELEWLAADADCDGKSKISTFDATLVLRASAKKYYFDWQL